MKTCLHKKFGSIQVTTFSLDQFFWCRNCGTLYRPGGGDEVVPQTQLEKTKKPSKKDAPKWEMTEEPF